MTKRACWSDAEKARLLKLRDADGLDWSAVAAGMPGRTVGACKVQYYGRLHAINGAKRYNPTRTLPPPPARPHPVAAPIVTPAPVMARAARGASLDVLREAAELRLRIAERGLTGGVLGDPPPGRSALDARATAAVGAAQRPSVRGGVHVR